MKLKPNLKLRKIGSRYMVVDATDTIDLAHVFTLNKTAAWLWQEAEGREFTAETLAARLCEAFDVDENRALQDVQRQLDEWKTFGLL